MAQLTEELRSALRRFAAGEILERDLRAIEKAATPPARPAPRPDADGVLRKIAPRPDAGDQILKAVADSPQFRALVGKAVAQARGIDTVLERATARMDLIEAHLGAAGPRPLPLVKSAPTETASDQYRRLAAETSDPVLRAGYRALARGAGEPE